MPTSVCASIYRGTPRNIARLSRALQQGELVGVPTETVYGLAANALDARACGKIFRAKGRPTNDPLIVHIHDLAQLDTLAERNSAVDCLAAKFWPGPLTLVLPKKPGVPGIVTSGQATVAVRMPRHPLFRKLLKACGLPLAAPSANPFGYISPTTAEHVREGLRNKIRFILDGGPSTIGLESTILDLRNPARPVLLRPGAIERADLEAALGRRVTTSRLRVAPHAPAAAPGLLSKHYSPRTPLILHSRLFQAAIRAGAPREVFVFQQRPPFAKGVVKYSENVCWLSSQPNLKEAAHNLFATLRRLDDAGWKKIHIELATGKSALALAINDRLERAAAR